MAISGSHFERLKSDTFAWDFYKVLLILQSVYGKICKAKFQFLNLHLEILGSKSKKGSLNLDFFEFFFRFIFMTKSLFMFLSHLSQKVCQFHKGSLQKLQKQSSQFLVISELFLTKFVKIRDFEIFPNCFSQNSQTHKATYSLFRSLIEPNIFNEMNVLLYCCF